MMATAHAPAHITGFFKIYSNGSTGAGVNLKEGVKTSVEVIESVKEKIEIFINKKKAAAPTSKTVIKKYLKQKKNNFYVKVFHKTNLPIGFGLGASGAGALSLSLALNKALKTRFSKKEILKIAFDAEIENKTGLGDVIAQQFSGLIRGLPKFPSKRAKKIPTKKSFCACAFFSPIKTGSIIKSKNWRKKINIIGSYCMKEITKKPTEKNFVHLSRVFCVESGLVTKKAGQVLDEVPNAMQAMLGSTVFILTKNPKLTEKKLKKFSNNVLVSRIATRGALVL